MCHDNNMVPGVEQALRQVIDMALDTPHIREEEVGDNEDSSCSSFGMCLSLFIDCFDHVADALCVRNV